MAHDSQGECRLCQTMSSLRDSHYIPAFVFKWLRDSSVGALRTVEAPNLRLQDGPRARLLCPDCEQRLSRWEKPFAEKVFLPAQTAPVVRETLAYGMEALPFAVSVAWRTLLYYQSIDSTILRLPGVSRCESIWREVLLEKRQHPGAFEQHVLHVDVVQQTGAAVSPFLNRYLLRAIHMDFVTSQHETFTYTKLGRLLFIGFLHGTKPRRWKGTKLHARGGHIGEGQVEVPGEFADFLNAKADSVAAALRGLSERQRAKIKDVFSSRSAEIVNSDILRAMQADLALTGDLAFSSTKPDDLSKKDA
jgi:hypothetical protein